MANLRADNLSGVGGRNAIDGGLYFGNFNNSQYDYLELADQEDLELGSGDYTVEFWCKPLRNGAVEEIVNKGYPFQVWRNSKAFTLAVDSNTSSYEINTAFGSGEAGEWHHIAVARSGNTTKCFLNGVEGLSSTANTSIYDSSSKFSIGRYSDGASYKYQGYVSNLRIVKGTALYTASFTPSTEKLTIVDGTVLLCCQDTDDPTQEATGKTITAYGNLDYSLRKDNLITNGNFRHSSVTGWTLASGSRALGTGQSGTFGDGNHLVLTSGTMTQAFTTIVGRTYLVNCQSNGADSSFISTSASSGDAIITDIRNTNGNNKVGNQRFVAAQTTYYVILTGGSGGGNFDTVSVYEQETPKAFKEFPPVGVDEGVVFEGDTKVNSLGYMYFPTGDTTQRSRGRAVIFGGTTTTPTYLKSISYYNISNFSSTHDFGDMKAAGGWMTACSSSTRGLAIGAGNGGGATNVVDYVEIATTGNGKDFGDLTEEKNYFGATSNQTRALRGGGYSVGTDTIDYATIATIGNFVDFGNLTQGRLTHEGGLSSPTRAIWGGGTHYNPNVVYHNIIDYVTIATTGNATDFGDMSVNRKAMAAVCSSTRGIWSGGYTPTYVDTMDYITIATTGNALDFGNSIWTGAYKSGTSNGTRGVWSGGRSPGGNPSRTNLIENVTIATTGDGTDFGDLDVRRDGPGACSDSHGGL